MKRVVIGHFRLCDIITMSSTMFAVIGIILCINNHFKLSFFCLILCGLCDMFDGFFARKKKYNIEQCIYGIELDSISDITAFGIFPAIITIVISNNIFGYLSSIFFVLCGLIRLSYFNMLCQCEKKYKGYIGVPITMSAVVLPLFFIIHLLFNINILYVGLPIILLLLGASYIIRIKIPKIDFINLFTSVFHCSFFKKICVIFNKINIFFKKIFNRYVLDFLIFPLFILTFSSLFFYIEEYEQLWDAFLYFFNNFSNILVLIFYILFIDLILVLLSSIFKKNKISKNIIFIVCIILIVINDIKYKIMLIPLSINDIGYLNKDSFSMMGIASTTIGSWIWATVLKALLMIFLYFLICCISKKKIVINTKKYRIIYLISSSVMITLFCILINSGVVCKLIYLTDKSDLNNLSSLDIINKYGFYEGMVIDYYYSNDVVDDSYSKKEAKNSLSNVKSNSKNWEKANVIFILSEAFFDVNNVSEIEFDRSVTPFFDSLEDNENSDTFNLLVTPHGGASCNTEFEILTGSRLFAWPAEYIPYNSYYLRNTSIDSPNLIKEFNKNNYETVYIAPWGKTLFNTESVYELLGTDKIILDTDLYGERRGYYYSDDSFVDDIYNELISESDEEYKFIFAATAENHYPYDYEKFDSYDINAYSDYFNEEEISIYRTYAQGASNADKSLEKLVNKIKDLDKKTIIIYFGDHLPLLGNAQGEDIKYKSSYFSTSNELLNELRSHTTRGAIISNYDIDIDDLEYLNSSYLGSYILNNMDLDISNYFKYVNNLYEKIPVFNRSFVYENDNIIPIDKYENKSYLDEYKNLIYYMFYEKNR